ncbi:MAG: ABC transporter ATP-binding protein [Myxococcales bacterium]|nr:ABC transporter ATP-binding protein [Myxococcales bacterium]
MSTPARPFASPPLPHEIALPSLWGYARRYWRLIALGSLALLAFNGAMVLLPWLLQRAVAALSADPPQPVLWVALEMVGVAIVAALIRIVSRTLLFNAGRDGEYDLRRDLFARLLTLPPSFFRRRSTGDVMSRLTNDLTAVRALLGFVPLNLGNTLFAYLFALTRLVTLSPRLTLFALLPFPLLLGVAQIYGRKIFRHGRAVQEKLGALTTTLQEDLAGMQVVKSHAVETERERVFRAVNDAWLRESLALTRARSTLMPLLAMGGGIATLIALWLGGREVVRGAMTLPRLVEFNALLAILTWPTLALGFVLAVVQRGRASWSRLAELLAEEPTIADSPGMEAPRAPIVGALALRGLTVVVPTEHGERRLLDAIDLDVAAGGSLALVGRTGGGKSTIAEVLPRLLEIGRGQAFLDGMDLLDLPLATVRGAIGYAPQEAFLFSTTIARNIAFGLPPRGRDGEDEPAPERDPRVLAAAEAAGLSRDLVALPHGIDTVVGERGITLSGGQRQRVALARALASDPAVLVLDDSLSSVDSETERDILGHLRCLRSGRTTVIISHRVAAVRECDQIAVIEGGRIAERGSHEALLAAGGIYADLYRSQLIEAQIEVATVEALA